VRALVTRSAGGPADVFRRQRDRRAKDAYDRLLPNPSNQSGTLIRAVSACSHPCGRTPVRTAFHDAVARFGGLGTRSERALSSRRVVEWREPRLTPLSLFGLFALTMKRTRTTVEPRPTHLASRERYGATPARDAFTLCVTPTLRFGSRVNPRVPQPLACARGHGGARGTMPIARQSRGRCNTTRDQVALANSRVLARDGDPSRDHRPTNIACRIACASTCFRTKRSAPVKSDSPRSPFIAVGGAPKRRSVAGYGGCEQRDARHPLRDA